MENATEALLIAFAIIVFTMALTVSFRALAQSKSTADVVLHYSDRETFQDFELKPDISSDKVGGRIVKIDTVIATLRKCIHENFAVTIKIGTTPYEFDYAIQTKENLENSINNFIKNYINNTDSFLETYVEVTLNGDTYTGLDGTKLEENVGKKLYIMYKKI